MQKALTSCSSKVSQLRYNTPSVEAEHQNVLRLDITVHNTMPVHVLRAGPDLLQTPAGVDE